MQIDFRVRLAELSDIPCLPEIERTAASLYQSYVTSLGLTKQILERVTPLDYLQMAQRDSRLWIAESSNGMLIGFALVAIRGESAHIDELNVLPEYGRNGVGSALVRAVCIWAACARLPSVTVSTFKDIPWNAPFYEHLGFHTIDPKHLPPVYAALVHSEQRRGLHQAPRVVMRCDSYRGDRD